MWKFENLNKLFSQQIRHGFDYMRVYFKVETVDHSFMWLSFPHSKNERTFDKKLINAHILINLSLNDN
jgi:hypothetical protein